MDVHSQPLVLCADEDCPGWLVSDERHFDLHNKPCAARFEADGVERLCELAAGHSGEHLAA